MEQIVDPAFGTLIFKPYNVAVGDWKKQDHLELLGSLIPLEIEGSADGPTEDQRQTYLAFKRADRGLRAELQEALFQFYQIQREQYADVYAEICSRDPEFSEEDFIPILAKPEDIWGILTPDSWTILGAESADYHFKVLGSRCDVRLSWHGCWDTEHEFSAFYEGDKLLGIGILEYFYRLDDLQAVAGGTGN